MIQIVSRVMYLIGDLSIASSDVHIVPERSHQVASGDASREFLVGEGVVETAERDQAICANLSRRQLRGKSKACKLYILCSFNFLQLTKTDDCEESPNGKPIESGIEISSDPPSSVSESVTTSKLYVSEIEINGRTTRKSEAV